MKHAVKTVAAVLDPSDLLAIVAWSSNSTVVTELTSMTDRGRSTANAKLDAIDVNGMTDIWDGLKTGLELLDAVVVDDLSRGVKTLCSCLLESLETPEWPIKL